MLHDHPLSNEYHAIWSKRTPRLAEMRWPHSIHPAQSHDGLFIFCQPGIAPTFLRRTDDVVQRPQVQTNPQSRPKKWLAWPNIDKVKAHKIGRCVLVGSTLTVRPQLIRSHKNYSNSPWLRRSFITRAHRRSITSRHHLNNSLIILQFRILILLHTTIDMTIVVLRPLTLPERM